MSKKYNRQKLFNLMDQDHGVILTETDMNDIEVICNAPFMARVKALEKEIMHQVGDTRMCPACEHLFIPHDDTAVNALLVLRNQNNA